MKYWRIAIMLLVPLALLGLTACNSLGGKNQLVEQSVKVVRGNLTAKVSGSGNIAVANEAKMSFGMAGRVDEIYVEEGEEVSTYQALAKLDTGALELALTQAQVARSQAQVAVTQAQVNLQTAEYNLTRAKDYYLLADIRIAQANVDEAQRDLDETLWTLAAYEPGSSGEKVWQQELIHAQSRLNTAKDTLAAMLTGTDTAEVAIKKLQVDQSQQSLVIARQSLELAGQSLKQAEKQLAEATIIAPFKGVIAKVNVDEKDTVLATTTVIHLIDPGSLELEVTVDEIDVPGVNVGQKANIEVDALPSALFEGKVSFIGLLPTEQTGVLVYNVKIKFDVPRDAGVRVGMSATADIIIGERSNVLVVPDRAIDYNSQANPIVRVMVNGQVEERPVVTGLSDGLQTEIVQGLKEGEEVIEKRTAPKSSSSGLF